MWPNTIGKQWVKQLQKRFFLMDLLGSFAMLLPLIEIPGG
jgi:hypothetical protein